jgi:WD40 repeat protein
MDLITKSLASLFFLSILWLAAGCQPADRPTLPETPPARQAQPTSVTATRPIESAAPESPPAATTIVEPTESSPPYEAIQLEAPRRLANGTILGPPVYSPDGSLLAIPTAAGLFLHDARTLALRLAIPGPSYRGLAAFSPDSRLVAVDRRGDVEVYDVAGGQLTLPLAGNPDSFVSSLAISPDGQLYAAGFEDGSSKVWRLSARELLLETPGSLVDFSPDSRQLVAVQTGERRARLIDLADGTVLGEWPGEQAFFTPGGLLGIANQDAFRLIDPQSGQARLAFNGSQPSISPDGSLLALSSLSQVHLYSTADGTRLRTMAGEYAAANQLLFSPDGQTLVGSTMVEMCPGCLTSLGPLAIWRVADGSLVNTIAVFNYDPWLAFDSAGHNLAAAEPDRLVFLDPADGSQAGHIAAYAGEVLTLAFSPDGQQLASAGYSSDSTRLWRAGDGSLAMEPRDPARGTNHMIGNAAFSPDGSILAVGTDFWRLPQGEDLHALELATEQVHHSLAESVAFSPVEAIVALGIGEGYIDMWRLDDFQQVGPLADNEGRALSLSFSPDGTRLAAAIGLPENAIQIWQFPERNLLNTIRGEQFFRVVFSPDGESLASLAAIEPYNEALVLAGKAQVWDSRDGRLLDQLSVEDASSLAYSPDGALLATGSYDGSLRLWRASDGQLLHSLPAHFAPVTGLAFSPGGALLASGSEDGSLFLWQVSGR